jgi:hypothetical protein
VLGSTRVLLSELERYDGGFFVACLCTPLPGEDLAGQLPRYRPTGLLARETNGDLALLLPGGGCGPPRRPPKPIAGCSAGASAAACYGSGRAASASISTSQAGSSRPATITAVAAGRISAKTSPCARATSRQCAASVM